MIRLRDAVLSSTLLLALGGASTSALAAGRFDGAWSVVATTDTGACTGPYQYPIVIRDGTVDDAGGNGVDASGRTTADGRISGTIRKGLASVLVSGRLRGSGGTGRWSLAGLGSCSGRWTARRTS
ncbi:MULTISPECIES: hypothetical protein [unclassified Methylobacterium]|uniref:hypothetical protein n=1 Tax=unclassified Methylobacterium TaxID=2615210 RepID=UPI001FB9C593|nr:MULTISPECIES: hypothetical protein [unclassified Methylobacterium]MCJ2019431.1 hypothetical protein [Methylobacterium sp. E-065]